MVLTVGDTVGDVVVVIPTPQFRASELFLIYSKAPKRSAN
jgi:hypothetical protein